MEHYHRSLHTLEGIQTHAVGPAGEHAAGETPFPATAVRVTERSAVRLTESARPVVPPPPPPPVPNPTEPITFDDAGPDHVPPTFMTGSEDPAMHSIDHRPRRLAGPLAAVAVVLVLVVVLIVTGLHTSSPSHRGHGSSSPVTKSTTATTAPTPSTSTPRGHGSGVGGHRSTTTSSSRPPAVSAPIGASAHAATYQVAGASYSLSLAATTGACWVDATETSNGSVLFTGTLAPGQSHVVTATGAVTVVAGAPTVFSATVDGSPVVLPAGVQAPVTLSFQPGSTS